MTAMGNRARRKLSLLDLAAELFNVSRACKIAGNSRWQFYVIRRKTAGLRGWGSAGPHALRPRSPSQLGWLKRSRRPFPSTRWIIPAMVRHASYRNSGSRAFRSHLEVSGVCRGGHNLLTKHQQLLRLDRQQAHARSNSGKSKSGRSNTYRRSSANATLRPAYRQLGGRRLPLRRCTQGIGKVYLPTVITTVTIATHGRGSPLQSCLSPSFTP